jgi:hypothetical protein
LQIEAAKIRLGVAPKRGTPRVFSANAIRGLVEGLGSGAALPGEPREMQWQIPERVEIQRAGGTKSCAEIAQWIDHQDGSASRAGEGASLRDVLECAAAHDIPEKSSLLLVRTTWNAGLHRWEFALRCGQPEECVPFLVWAKTKSASPQSVQNSKQGLSEKPRAAAGGPGLIRPGESATLVWDQGGIRVVLPVTCLDGGGMGQSIRVRVRNSDRMLRAQVAGAGRVRVGL